MNYITLVVDFKFKEEQCFLSALLFLMKKYLCALLRKHNTRFAKLYWNNEIIFFINLNYISCLEYFTGLRA